ncbi:phosphoribosylglycinamide formyltransferase [Candidatus Micrarchaeota archaeon]|nr:phosphoribosylglycinamide formyltransferase [Candidatus Micrarchaeota archaeon]
MVSFAILASGSGTNFQALIDGVTSGELKNVELKLLITDNVEAKAIERAKKAGIPHHVVLRADYPTREEMDREIIKLVESHQADYIFLLGYMKILKADEFFQKYMNKIINLHPSILPSFVGMDAQKQAFDYGCKVSGITVHFVDSGLDHGPVIYQKCADISNCKSWEEVHEVLRVLEHRGVKKVAEMLAKGRFIVEGRRTHYVEDAPGKESW